MKSLFFISFTLLFLQSYALLNYKLPADFQQNLTQFLDSKAEDWVPRKDVLRFISPLLRGSVERHDRELMSAIVKRYLGAEESINMSKTNIINALKPEAIETYANEFAMKMYKHLIELYEIEDEITDDEFAKMIDDPELYGLIWEDYLIMTENVEELLLETEYDEFDLEKAAKELSEMWENFDIDAFNAIENQEEKKAEEEAKSETLKNQSEQQEKQAKVDL